MCWPHQLLIFMCFVEVMESCAQPAFVRFKVPMGSSACPPRLLLNRFISLCTRLQLQVLAMVRNVPLEFPTSFLSYMRVSEAE